MTYETKKRIYRDAIMGIEPYPDDTPEMLQFRKDIEADMEKYGKGSFTFGIPDE